MARDQNVRGSGYTAPQKSLITSNYLEQFDAQPSYGTTTGGNASGSATGWGDWGDSFTTQVSRWNSDGTLPEAGGLGGTLKKLRGDGTGRSIPQTKQILGEATGNSAFRNSIILGKNGVPFKVGGASTAILYKVQARAGRYGFRSMGTNRYRNKFKSTHWSFQLKPATGPNKSLHGVAQSSLDTTKEKYTTAETRSGVGGVYNRNEQFNEQTRKFERQWKGWKELKINNTWKHYKLDRAPMFKEQKVAGIDTGAARRVERRVR